MVLVTDVEWEDPKLGKRRGYYMDGYLYLNLKDIPSKLLANDYDCVGIVTGKGRVRVGKSTMAMACGHFLAWTIAGGEMITEPDPNDDRKFIIKHIKKPKKPVRFNLYENVVFTPDQLQSTAKKLFNKYGKNQVIVYDEGRQGMSSARAMESINKIMEDFFETCGSMGHVIILVLPNFFKLHEDYAVARSIFLIDCYRKNFKRGYFNFYNEKQKEKLYYFGKKLVGVTAKYSAANVSFYGRFTDWWKTGIINKEEYETYKKKCLANKKAKNYEVKFKKQRDACIYLLDKYSERTQEDLAREISAISNASITSRLIRRAIANITHSKDDME